jgi:hypothetical protein
MDSFQNDIEKMSLETFQILEEWRKAQELQELQEVKAEVAQVQPSVLITSVPEIPVMEEVGEIAPGLPQGAGLLYRIEKGQSTFCLRILPCHNIESSYSKIESGESSQRKILKLNEEDALDEVSFFETFDYALAEVLTDQFANRRWPYHEEQVCNISDPGHSWWMHLDEQNGIFKIYFRIQSIETHKNLIQLGPIADLKLAQFCFRDAQALFSSLFPVEEFSLSDKYLLVKTFDVGSQNFQKLASLFLTGDSHVLGTKTPANAQMKTLHLFLRELALSRKFWMDLTHKLIDKFEAPLQ